ncbi:MAG TPA: SH3 domain-containing protein [Usitatibacter sp.]|nr:SH3 domain-containing protein [Usitatibacter sp.]
MRYVLLAVLLASHGAGAQPSQPPSAVPHSPLQWELRNGEHPKLGAIQVAVPSASMATAVGKEKILSLVFFSCEKARGRIAIELANAPESDAKSGLRPRQMPRLFCNPRSTAPRSEIAASWVVSEIGDALARGLAPSDLRRCASIEIAQDVALPRGWAGETQHIEMELIPYKKELEAVLATCSQAPGPMVAEAPKAASPESPKPAVATPPRPVTPPPPKTPAVAEAEWQTVRTTAPGRTNVRSGPGLDSPVVAQLDPGVLILVQPASNEWFKARARMGAGFIGYVRRDRLVFP